LPLVLVAGCFDLDAVAHDPAPQSLVDDWRDEVIYQLVTDRFANGDVNNDADVDHTGLALARYQGGDFVGITQHLDYLEALGITAIWISPVFRTVDQDTGIAGYHGYWPQDFVHVNPHFGDLAALRELVAACHTRHIKVILDTVVNHIGQLFYYDINENGQPDQTIIGTGAAGPLGSPGGAPIGQVNEFDPDWNPRGIQAATALGSSGIAPIRWLNQPELNRVPPWPAVFQNPDFYHRRGRIIDYGDRQQVLLGDFPGGLKDLATDRADVRQALVDVYTYWLDAVDFDGLRVDTAKHVEPEFFSDAFAPALRAHAAARGKRNLLLFGEVFDGDDALNATYTRPRALDAVIDFPHKYRVVDGVLRSGGPTAEIGRLRADQARDYPFPPQPGGIGIAPAAALVRFLDNHDVARFLYSAPGPAALRSALAYLLTSDGVPSLYYGTEQEFAGGADPANRERLWETRFDSTGETFRYLQALIALRKQLAPLRRGDLTIRWASDHVGAEEDAGVYALERAIADDRVLVVLSVSDAHPSHTAFRGMTMPTGFAPGTGLRAAFPPGSAERLAVDAGGHVTVSVAPREAKVFVVDR
jgi:glycosidase